MFLEFIALWTKEIRNLMNSINSTSHKPKTLCPMPLHPMPYTLHPSLK